MGHTFYDLTTLPNQYDIVWCLYPQRETRPAPGPYVRPCLVLDVRVDAERSIGALIVSYGTGVYDKEKHKTDLIIDDQSEVRALGLHKPTRFALSLNSRMLLPWCEEYFTDEQIERLIDCLRLQKLEPYTGSE